MGGHFGKNTFFLFIEFTCLIFIQILAPLVLIAVQNTSKSLFICIGYVNVDIFNTLSEAFNYKLEGWNLVDIFGVPQKLLLSLTSLRYRVISFLLSFWQREGSFHYPSISCSLDEKPFFFLVWRKSAEDLLIFFFPSVMGKLIPPLITLKAFQNCYLSKSKHGVILLFSLFHFPLYVSYFFACMLLLLFV